MPRYILKKFVQADCAREAIKLDRLTPVAEVFVVQEKPGTGKDDSLADCIGFTHKPEPEE